jgi:hypothetical protein
MTDIHNLVDQNSSSVNHGRSFNHQDLEDIAEINKQGWDVEEEEKKKPNPLDVKKEPSVDQRKKTFQKFPTISLEPLVVNK